MGLTSLCVSAIDVSCGNITEEAGCNALKTDLCCAALLAGAYAGGLGASFIERNLVRKNTAMKIHEQRETREFE